ncbi:MAG: glycerol-3-phosphate acyltransferase [Brevinematia bacterium]
MELVKVSLSVVSGYLIGSILPGYFLPLWIKGIDIRKYGDGNPGVVNVKRNAGVFIAILTAIYDVSKGLLALFIAYKLFKLPFSYSYLAGFAAVIGNKFSIFLNFKGGRGIAATIGLFLFIFLKIIVCHLTPLEVFSLFAYIVIYALLLNIATHNRGDFFTVTIFPFLALYVILKIHIIFDLIFFLALSSVITVEAFKNLKRDEYKFYNEKQTFWRIIARPFALLFIPLGILLPKMTFLFLVGGVLAVFFLLDMLRILIPKIENVFQMEIVNSIRFFKKKEEGKISSMTNFLLGIFLCFVLFDRNVAFAALGFVSLGDMFGKIVGINSGRKKIFKKSERTLEGSLAFLSATITVAFFMWITGLLSLPVVLTGAFIATVTEAIPAQLDDNFSIPVVSGGIMELIKRFLIK